MTKLVGAEEQRLLVKVSKMYYEENLTQDVIMNRLKLSRSKVSRLLEQARRSGIVQITVIDPRGIFSNLESKLEKHFHIQEAVVVEANESDSQETVNRQLGIAAANYLRRTIKDCDTIGVSWGSTLKNMVGSMQPLDTHNVQVIQIIGGLGHPESEDHATDLCRRMARYLGCRVTLLPAPGIVNSQLTKKAFLSDIHVQKAQDMFARLDVAYVGIGAPTPNSVMMRDGSIISQSEMDDLLSKGAVGDIALRFFDVNGSPVPSEVDLRVIGITLEQLRKVKCVIGVAGGPEKLTAIQGSLKGNLIDVIITDSVTAIKLVKPAL
jgi:DNA-binding transcriptional regulator LsrR (DeoR family)